MTVRMRWLGLMALASLVLSGCSTAGGADGTSASAGGVIELAVAEVCEAGSDPQCVLVGEEYVVVPSDFESAGVESAAAIEDAQQNAVEVTLTSEGAAVLNDLSGQAAQAGDDTRLLFKVDDDILSAVRVMDALQGNQVVIALGSEDAPQELVDRLQGS
ncbi:hypothetical protein AB0O87_05385 [Microbacterium sp. NPDC076768]|uniref:hypothetical protein n=1 Tax=Microbacterium sp. NPDC076768 TaxID=3154858 RepID=UPI003413F7BD